MNQQHLTHFSLTAHSASDADFVSVIEAGKKHGLTNDHLASLCRKGKIKGILEDRQWFIDEASLEEYLIKIQAEKEIRNKRLSETFRRQSGSSSAVTALSNPVNQLTRLDLSLQIALCALILFATIFTVAPYAAASDGTPADTKFISPNMGSMPASLSVGITGNIEITNVARSISNQISAFVQRVPVPPPLPKNTAFANTILPHPLVSSADLSFVPYLPESFAEVSARLFDGSVGAFSNKFVTDVYALHTAQIAFYERAAAVQLVATIHGTAHTTLVAGVWNAWTDALTRTLYSSPTNDVRTVETKSVAPQKTAPKSVYVAPVATEQSMRVSEVRSSQSLPVAYVTQSSLMSQLQRLDSKLRQLISENTAAASQGQNSYADLARMISLTQRIDNLPSTVLVGGSTIVTQVTIPAITELDGVLSIAHGGLGTSTVPAANQVLLSDANGNWEYVATSSLGISAGGGAGATYTFTYPLLNAANTISLAFGTTTTNVWSNVQTFTSGIYSQASSTIADIFNATNGAQLASTTLYGNTLLFSATTTNLAVLASTTIRGVLNVGGSLNANSGGTFTGTFGGTHSYSGLVTFSGSNSLIAQGSTTIGSGALTGGLTVSGGATTTGTAYFGGNVGLGTTTPGTLLSLGNTGANTVNISATATSTFGSGIVILTGCFSVNGTCLQIFSTSSASAFLAANTGNAFSTTSASTFFITGLAFSTTTTNTFTGANIFQASTTIGSGTQTGGLTVSGGATTTGLLAVTGAGTSTFSGSLSLLNFAQTGSATSTYSNGITLAAGCFSVNGACLQIFATTSANYFIAQPLAQGLAFSTTSATNFISQATNQGIAFSSTSATNFISQAVNQGISFSTTSATNFISQATNQGLAFSTTSANVWSLAGLGFSTTSASNFFRNGLAFSTTTTNTFTGANIFQASTTIGGGATTTGLTISGGATTTGAAYFAGSLTFAGTLFAFTNPGTTTISNSPYSWSLSTSTTAVNQAVISVSGSGATSTISLFGATTTALVSGTGSPANSLNSLIIGSGTTVANVIIANGSLCVSGRGWCTASSTGGFIAARGFNTIATEDLAENYFSSNYALVPGNIVEAVGGASVDLASKAGGHTVLGIVSTEPGITLGLDPDPLMTGPLHPIALAGRVPVLVNLDNGPIAIGDYITLSTTTPGVGMKAGPLDSSVGIALEPYNASSVTKSIMVFVNLQKGFAVSTFADALLASSTNPDEHGFVERLFSALTSNLQQWFASATNGITTLFANEMHTKKLCVSDDSGAEICITKGQLENLIAGAAATQSSQTSSNVSSEQQTPSTKKVPPTITIHGANPALITIGDTYNDLGATAQDSAGTDLSLRTYVDGVEVSHILINATAARTYSIEYVTTDNAGATATSSRSVIVQESAQH